MKDEKKLKELAEEILRLEEQCQLKNNISENMIKIEELILKNNLSLEELLEIDTYIQEKKLLTN